MPQPSGPLDSFEKGKFGDMSKNTVEGRMRQALVRLKSSLLFMILIWFFQITFTNTNLHEMIIIDTSSKANKVTDHRAPAGCQPDCVVYHRTCEEKDGLNASLVDFFIEFKTDHDYDPFAHRGDTLLCDTKNGSETCGQITSYATLLLGT